MKKSFKKAISVLLVAIMVLGSAPLLGAMGSLLPEDGGFIPTAEAVTGGDSGENLTWSFDETTGVLAISGDGTMQGWSSLNPAPWQTYASDITSVKIGEGVTDIGAYAFADCENLAEISIPDTVAEIGNRAFDGCVALTSVKIPEGVERIGKHAFLYCENLKSVVIPDSVTSLGDHAFSECIRLKTVKLSNSIDKIDYYTFDGCNSLVEVVIPDSVKTIGEYAFNGCVSLERVTIGKEVTSIGEAAFRHCNMLWRVTIPDKVTVIGDYAFDGCSRLLSVTIGSGVETVGRLAFWNCVDLKNVDIPDSVKLIEDSAFKSCESLENVTIGSGIKTIEKDAFIYCDALKTVRYNGTEEDWNEVSVDESNENLFAADLILKRKLVLNSGDEQHEFIFFEGDDVDVNYQPQKTGYDFAGWSSEIPEKMPDKNVEIDALWNIRTHKVTFMLKDSVYEEYLVDYNANVPVPDTSDMEGYEFICWLNENGNEAVIPLAMPDKDLVFTMKYNEQVKNDEFDISVTFNGESQNENVNLSVSNDTTQSETYAYFKARLDSNRELLEIYNIKLVDGDGEKIELDGERVTVRIKVDQDLTGVNFTVIHKPGTPGYNLEYYMSTKNEVRYEDGYIIFEVTHFSHFAVCIDNEPPTVKIRNNTGVANVNYGDVIRFTAEVADMPESARVCWYVDGVKSGYGETFEAKFKKTCDVWATVVDAEGREYKDYDGKLINDSQKVNVNASIWMKIISFFKDLFGIYRTVIQFVTKP